MTAALAFLLNNKWLWWLGAALALVAVYFGWRAHQRGIGAAKVIDQLRKETDEARGKMDKAAGEYRRDGARKRLRDADF